MAQYDFGTIDPNTKSGTALASDLNSWRNAVHSTHSGSSAPSYTTAAMLWADTTSANYELKMYDGAQWIPVAVIDATNNVARVAVDSAETSYITSTTNAQIRHVIANTDVFTTRSTGIQFNIASPIIADSNNNELISFTTTASAVNQVAIANAATGNPPTISSAGGDTNINLLLTAKGTGIVYTYSETSATNTVIDVARLEARSTGTPAAGIGASLLFATETAANNFEIGARINAFATDVNAGTENFALAFRTMRAGAAAAEVMRITNEAGRGVVTGFGTTAPLGNFHIRNTEAATNTEMYLESTVGATYLTIDAASSYCQLSFENANTPVGELYALDTTSGMYLNSTAGDVTLQASYTDVVHVKPTGRAGIMTPSPLVQLHVTGDTMTTGRTYLAQGTQTTETAAATLTIAELETGIIQYTGAAATLTLPTGTLIQSGLPTSFPSNMAFDFSVINTGTGTATLGTATGLTLTGGMTVTAGTSGMFRVRRTGTNVFTVYRIG